MYHVVGCYRFRCIFWALVARRFQVQQLGGDGNEVVLERRLLYHEHVIFMIKLFKALP